MDRVIFIRHNLREDKAAIKRLFEQHLIAIHYDDIPSTNPKDYSGKMARRAVEMLCDCCKTGALVGADYSWLDNKPMLIGVIQKGSNIEPKNNILKNAWLKTVELKDVKVIYLNDYPHLAKIRPPRITISNWPKAKDTLKEIYT
ncbi:MAG: hypothetical protein QXS98_06235 [Candidatus Nitrosocaldus sp.]